MAKKSVFLKREEGELLDILGTQVKFLCTGNDTESDFSMLEVLLPKGTGAPPHHHPWDETYYLLAGNVDFQLGDKTMAIKTGDFIYAPAGTVHSFKGASTQPAKMLVLDVPSHSEGFFREIDKEIKRLPEDLVKVPGIGKRHQLTFI